MKNFLIAFITPMLTFVLGVGIYRISVPNVSLTTISEHTDFYDGMNVEIETYIQLENHDAESWYIGEPFEKKEVWGLLNLENNSTNLDNLRSQLRENLSGKHFKRAKVLVRGTIQDNCNKGSTCCFGRSITIKAQEVEQLAPVEDYIKPE